MATKSTFALQFTGSEAENAMRKMVFAAAVGIQDGTLSNLAQPLVRIALKLFMLLRAHRAAHAGPGDDDPSFIVLTETKFSFRCIPVWDRYSPHRTRVEKKHM